MKVILKHWMATLHTCHLFRNRLRVIVAKCRIFHEFIEFLKVCDLLVMDIFYVLLQVLHRAVHVLLLVFEPRGESLLNLLECYLLAPFEAIHDLLELFHHDPNNFGLHAFL